MCYEEPDTEVCEVCADHQNLINVSDQRCVLASDIICLHCCAACDINAVCVIKQKAPSCQK